MRLVDKHICGFSRLFLVLFFLANSGFTVVLYRCTMTKCAMTGSVLGMECCSKARMDCCTAGSCEEVAVPQVAVADAVTMDRPCETATVAGGYQTDPTVVEKQVNGRQLLTVDLLPTSAFETGIGPRVDLPAFHFTSTASNVSPPSVETYVLNASFLI